MLSWHGPFGFAAAEKLTDCAFQSEKLFSSMRLVYESVVSTSQGSRAVSGSGIWKGGPSRRSWERFARCPASWCEEQQVMDCSVRGH